LISKTGKPLWTERRKLNSDGSLTYADGRLYCYSDKDGTFVLLEPSPAKWLEHGRAKIPVESELRQVNGKNLDTSRGPPTAGSICAIRNCCFVMM